MRKTGIRHLVWLKVAAYKANSMAAMFAFPFTTLTGEGGLGLMGAWDLREPNRNGIPNSFGLGAGGAVWRNWTKTIRIR